MASSVTVRSFVRLGSFLSVNFSSAAGLGSGWNVCRRLDSIVLSVRGLARLGSGWNVCRRLDSIGRLECARHLRGRETGCKWRLSVKQSLLIDGAFTARCVSAIQDTLSVYGSFQAFLIFSGTVRSVRVSVRRSDRTVKFYWSFKWQIFRDDAVGLRVSVRLQWQTRQESRVRSTWSERLGWALLVIWQIFPHVPQISLSLKMRFSVRVSRFTAPATLADVCHVDS